MSLPIESKKLKRTGYRPAFFAGSLLAAAFPVVNMAVRSENYISLTGRPLTILMTANWQMMAMLNLLMAVCGACIMYHTEYADNGAQKMDVLPLRPENQFLWKFVTAALASAGGILMEMLILAGCARRWFESYTWDLAEFAANTGFQIVLMLPTIMLMLVIASACRNMWVSLGIGVILVFTLSIMPQNHLFLNLCPFSAPYQMLDTVLEKGRLQIYLAAAGIETVIFLMLEMIYLKIRRCFD